MPGLTVTLEIRIKLADGRHPFVPAVITSNGRVKPFVGMVNGKEEQHKEGSYYIRWRENGSQPRACVGRDPQLALIKMQRKEQVLKSLSLGLKIEDEANLGSMSYSLIVMDARLASQSSMRSASTWRNFAQRDAHARRLVHTISRSIDS